MVELMKGIHVVDHSEAKDHSLETWILDCPEGTVLIDGGQRPDAVDNIKSELDSMGKKWKDVKLILVTHKHGDHINNLPKLKELTGAKVMSEEHEAPLIKDAKGVTVEGLKDGSVIPYCGGIQVVHIPGHSEGNSSYYLMKHKVMIAGDTIFGDPEGNIAAPPERYCLDVDQATCEIKRLLNYDFDVLLITHGKGTTKGAKEKVRKLVEETS
jgi:glyoxylase-like metal-dependent hydrolase (beta-lactamase superfamily II)